MARGSASSGLRAKQAWFFDGDGNPYGKPLTPSSPRCDRRGRRACGRLRASVHYYDRQGTEIWKQQIKGVIAASIYRTTVRSSSRAMSSSRLTGWLPGSAGARNSIKWTIKVDGKLLSAATTGDGTLSAFGARQECLPRRETSAVTSKLRPAARSLRLRSRPMAAHSLQAPRTARRMASAPANRPRVTRLARRGAAAHDPDSVGRRRRHCGPGVVAGQDHDGPEGLGEAGRRPSPPAARLARAAVLAAPGPDCRVAVDLQLLPGFSGLFTPLPSGIPACRPSG